jgi:hypothetical protein
LFNPHIAKGVMEIYVDITLVDGDFSASFAYENTGYSRFSSS